MSADPGRLLQRCLLIRNVILDGILVSHILNSQAMSSRNCTEVVPFRGHLVLGVWSKTSVELQQHHHHSFLGAGMGEKQLN